jgi:predicted HTH transcriptional regulator
MWMSGKLIARLEADDINPPLKVKGRRRHNEQRAYPPRALVELLVNMLVHRNYEIPDPAEIDISPGLEVSFENPGGLLPAVARRVSVQNDGRFILSERFTDPRNPSLCDVFFGLSAMEREGTGILDVCDLMQNAGGSSAFEKLPRRGSCVAPCPGR